MSGTLDQGLKEQALSCGVEIQFNRKMDEHEVDLVANGPVSDKRSLRWPEASPSGHRVRRLT